LNKKKKIKVKGSRDSSWNMKIMVSDFQKKFVPYRIFVFIRFELKLSDFQKKFVPYRIFVFIRFELKLYDMRRLIEKRSAILFSIEEKMNIFKSLTVGAKFQGAKNKDLLDLFSGKKNENRF
jgi:hypothetical protein